MYSYYSVKLNDLPSRGIAPYGKDCKFKIGLFTLGDVKKLSAFKKENDELGMLEYLENTEIINTTVPFNDLTFGDFLWFLLTIASSSYLKLIYTIAKDCPNPECLNMRSYADVSLPDSSIAKREIKGGLKIKVNPATLTFMQIDEDIKGKAEIVLNSNKRCNVDFFRVSHYKEFLKDTSQSQLQLMTDVDIYTLGVDEYSLVNYAMTKLDHGPVESITVTCEKCGYKEEFEFDWRGLDFIPFSPDDDILRTRISFGTGIKPTNPINTNNGLQLSATNVQKFNNISEGN